MAIYVIKEERGNRRTLAAINHINRTTTTTPYLYIVPTDDDADRICDACKRKRFKYPEVEEDRWSTFKEMIEKQKNIVITEDMFHELDRWILKTLQDKEYTLFLDGVTLIKAPFNLTRPDIDILKTYFVSVGDDGCLVWTDREYRGVFERDKRVIDNGLVYAEPDGTWVYDTPQELFHSFKDIFVLTSILRRIRLEQHLTSLGIECNHMCISGAAPRTFRFSELPAV